MTHYDYFIVNEADYSDSWFCLKLFHKMISTTIVADPSQDYKTFVLLSAVWIVSSKIANLFNIALQSQFEIQETYLYQPDRCHLCRCWRCVLSAQQTSGQL